MKTVSSILYFRFVSLNESEGRFTDIRSFLAGILVSYSIPTYFAHQAYTEGETVTRRLTPERK